MSLLNKAKQLLSLFTSRPIEKGIGLSFDDTITLPKGTSIEKLEGSTCHVGTFFQQKPVPGPFELVGFARSGESTVYQLKHRYTGETFNVSRKILDFLFEKYEL